MPSGPPSITSPLASLSPLLPSLSKPKRARAPTGAVLGNPSNLNQVGSLGRAALMESAEVLAHSLAPVLLSVLSEGATTLRSIAQALNRRGVKSPRGGTWHPSSVANLLSRI